MKLKSTVGNFIVVLLNAPILACFAVSVKTITTVPFSGVYLPMQILFLAGLPAVLLDLFIIFTGKKATTYNRTNIRRAIIIALVVTHIFFNAPMIVLAKYVSNL